MNIKPLADRILVRRFKEEEVTQGGIIIPEIAKEKPAEGLVVARGKGKALKNGTRLPLEVKNGDHILFSKYAGTEIPIKGENYLIMREDDILAIKADEGRGWNNG